MVKDSVTTGYTYNANNQLLTETTAGVTITYKYDDNGSLILKKTDGTYTTGYMWDGLNRLLAILPAGDNIVYEYDGDGNRISKTQGGVKTKYINDVARGLVQVLQETDNTGVTQATYTRGRGLIAMNRADADSYYHYDGLGTVRQMTDDSGAVIASYTYDSFGNLIASTGTIANTYGFTGEQQFVEADDLVFLRARYYKPTIGRFLSPDPSGYKDGVNLYRYVRNNPAKYTDSSGLSISSCHTMLVDIAVSGLLNKNDLPGGVENDKFAHCYVSCRLQQECGTLTTYMLGILRAQTDRFM